MTAMTDKSQYVPNVDFEAVEAYCAADRAGKAAIRTSWAKRMNEAIDALDIFAANDAKATIAAFAPSRPEPTKPNYAALVANRVETLRMAANLLESGQITPEGFNSDIMDEIDFSDLPDGTADTDNAHRIASNRIFRTRTDETHAIAPIVASVLESVESGTFLTIAAIRNRARALGLVPNSWNGDGALAAHLFVDGSPREIDGATVHNMTPERPRGITKL